MKTALVFVAVAIAMGSVSPAGARPLAPQEKEMVRQVVTKDFKDPVAAKFKWLPLIDRAKWLPDADRTGRWKLISCGLVNGKNSYGGYIGYAPYAVGLTMEKNRVIAADLIGIAQGEQASIDFIPRLCEDGQDTAQAN